MILLIILSLLLEHGSVIISTLHYALFWFYKSGNWMLVILLLNKLWVWWRSRQLLYLLLLLYLDLSYWLVNCLILIKVLLSLLRDFLNWLLRYILKFHIIYEVLLAILLGLNSLCLSYILLIKIPIFISCNFFINSTLFYYILRRFHFIYSFT